MPRRKRSNQLTPVELEIIQVLWEHGPAPVQAVQERLGGGVAYTTVQTMLNVLVRKGKVKRTLVDRAYRYRPAITREKALGATLGRLPPRAPAFPGSSASRCRRRYEPGL